MIFNNVSNGVDVFCCELTLITSDVGAYASTICQYMSYFFVKSGIHWF